MKVPQNVLDLCGYLEEKKAEDIVIIDTTKMSNIANYNINFDLKLIILVILLSSTGLSIIIQTIYFIKQKAPDNIRYFIKSMIINRIKLILFNTILFTLFFKFFI